MTEDSTATLAEVVEVVPIATQRVSVLAAPVTVGVTAKVAGKVQACEAEVKSAPVAVAVEAKLSEWVQIIVPSAKRTVLPLAPVVR